MFDRENFSTIVKSHMEKYKVLKEAKEHEKCVWELEKIIELMSEAITTIFGKPKVNYLKAKPTLLEGVRNITLEDVLDPNKVITIDKEGFLRVKT